MYYRAPHNNDLHPPMIWPYFIPPALLGASVGAYDFLEGETLVRDLWYEFRLSRTGIGAADRECAQNPNRSGVIVSLTTIPSRIDFIADTLKSLMLQTSAPEEIRLNLPRMSRREGVAYTVPPWLARLDSVKIVPCEDYGPATKLLPALAASAPDQAILVVDDDRIYPPNLIADLASAARRAPRSAFGLGGWVAPHDLVDRPTTLYSNLFQRAPAPVRSVRLRKPVAVDILQGMAGYMVRPRFFDLAAVMDYSQAPKAAFYVDDVWISAHCRAAKFVIPVRRTNFPPKRRASLYKRSSLGWINRGRGRDEDRNNTIMLKYFSGAWTVGGCAPQPAGLVPEPPRG